jgi:4-diphosphocytidyl-2-C-methyl-D-erythritol kinase
MASTPDTNTLELLAPAKLNLFLHITGRRDDGYHELQTVFQLLDWGDTLRFAANTSGSITLAGDTDGIPEADNLIVRAAQLLQRDGLGVDIEVEKRIPTGGGLGGGSSDAATTLLALNHLWGAGMTNRALQGVGASLGADVPVFVGGRTAWAEGIGEILTPVDLPASWFLIVLPPCHVPTGQIFSHRQLTRNSKPIKMAAFFAGDSRNDCQDLVRQLYPEVDKALIVMDNFGEARLTGTGACVFVRFETQAQAEAAQSELPTQWISIVAQGTNEAPGIRTLL